jgi:signal transduction histidine kinase
MAGVKARGYTGVVLTVFANQIRFGSIFRVLVVGFTTVIILLVVAGAIALNSAHSVKQTAAALVSEQLTTTRLIEEVEREQQAINAVFYKLTRTPELVDRERLLAELDDADERIRRIFAEAGNPQEGVWRNLRQASLSFSAEARRLLSQNSVSSFSSRDLFRRHEEVTSLIAKLIAAGYQRAVAAQDEIERRSERLVRESLILLGACLAAALICSVLTVRIAAQLFRKMEWQTGELSRVSWHLLENQETTARRFSHELHDELGQSLTAVKANLMAINPRDPAERARVEDCRRLVEDSVRNVRELSQLLRPTILDDFGLDASIRWLAERFTQRTGIEVNYESKFQERLPDETETHLFRIVQEALTNTARHSGATRVEIRLRIEGNRICLSFRDNGKGIEPGNGTNGMGMIGMRARARGAGGELTIRSRPGDGVRIEAWAPVVRTQDGVAARS